MMIFNINVENCVVLDKPDHVVCIPILDKIQVERKIIKKKHVLSIYWMNFEFVLKNNKKTP